MSRDTSTVNILFVMTGNPSVFGGGKRAFLQLMRGISKNRFNVFSCCPFDATQQEQLIREGITVVKMSLPDNNPIVYISRLSRILRTHDIHIVHSQGPRADFFSRIASRLAHKPIVVNTCAMLVDSYDITYLKQIVYLLCDRATERYVDKFIVVSETLMNDLVTQHGIQPDKIVLIHNGIELDRYRPNGQSRDRIRTQYLVRDDEMLVGTVGRMVFQKGYECLLQAVPQILQAFPKVRIMFVGDGPLRMKLESLAKWLGVIQRCIFVGFRDDIAEVLSAFDVFVLPSIVEGHPIAILEAMAMEKAIVASDIAGIREQIENGRTGILVPVQDPTALARGINQLLQNRYQAGQFGMEARKQAEEMFDVRRQVALHEKVYEGLVKGSKINV